jgi:hypothetical protein
VLYIKMELPFAVESTDSGVQGSTLHQSDSSLVTASSHGSFMDSSQLDGPLPPNTPQDVVLPRYENRQQAETHQSHPPPPIISGQISSQREQDEPEIIDFTYVNVSEDDADDVGILLEGGDLDMQPETQRGDILTVLLSGMQHHGNEAILVSSVCGSKASGFSLLLIVDSEPAFEHDLLDPHGKCQHGCYKGNASKKGW